MESARARVVEALVERAASATLAGSCGYAAWAVGGQAGTSASFPTACAVAAGAYIISLRVLARVDAEGSFVIPKFEQAELPDAIELEELLLTDSDRLPQSRLPQDEEPLLLDDVLAELDAESRVVRLFDVNRMPTPGQLDARIREHLGSPRAAAAAPPDATQALHDALAELRRSLR